MVTIGATGLVAVLVACGQATPVDPEPDSGASGTLSSTPDATARGASAGVPTSWPQAIDSTSIPMGVDAYGSSPAEGTVFSCQSNFGGRGTPHGGPWIDDAAGTWDSTEKVAVQGENTWPEASYAESVEGGNRTITFQDVPVGEVTGNFPIATDDPAYQYDRNPNAVSAREVQVTLPTNPVPADQPSCVTMGPVGVLKNGVYLYNGLDAAGGDAVAHETQDICQGHPDGTEAYHYHHIPACLVEAVPDGRGATLVGYALDGYGIYVERDAQGNLPTNADLDECHGRTSTVPVGGEDQDVYHYSATMEFPYTVGCFRGTPTESPRRLR